MVQGRHLDHGVFLGYPDAGAEITDRGGRDAAPPEA